MDIDEEVLEKMAKEMNCDFKKNFKFVRFENVKIVDEGYTFEEGIYRDSDADLFSDKKCQKQEVHDLMSRMDEIRTVIAISRERMGREFQHQIQTKVLIGSGNTKEYLLEGKELSYMLNEILHLLDEKDQIKTESLMSFVKKYGYLHKPKQNLLHNGLGLNFKNDGLCLKDESPYNVSQQFSIVEFGYDSLDTWQRFVQEITEVVRCWKNPLYKINIPCNGDKDCIDKFWEMVIQVNETILQRDFLGPKSSLDLSLINNDKQKFFRRLLLSKMIQRGIENSQFNELFYVLPSSGQILPQRAPIDLYSFIWLWIEQSVLNENDPNSIHKCCFCNEYDILSRLSKIRKRDPITQEYLWKHEKCYRRVMRRKKK